MNPAYASSYTAAALEENERHGGSAFPSELMRVEGGGTVASFGMSLRDWFAGQALGSIIATHEGPWITREEDCARKAYAIADAMLAARGKA